jgi:hypothetical protein
LGTGSATRACPASARTGRIIGRRFVRKIQDASGVEIAPEWIFDHPTIQQFAQLLDEKFGRLA